MWEPCALAVIYTTMCMVLPLFFSACTPTECKEIDVSVGRCGEVWGFYAAAVPPQQ